MSDTTSVVGLVGLGLVGRALAHRLSIAGLAPIGFDRRDAANADFVQAGGRVAASLAELGARCDRVVLAVFDSAGVLEVVEALLGHATLRVVIDCSTGDPDALSALAVRLATRGVDFIEAPLSGSSQQIQQGAATMLLGAEPAALQRHAALLDALSSQRIVVGGAGMGARAKLATNLVLGLNRAALAEGMVFAERLGIAPGTFLTLVLATPARSDAALAKGALMVSGEFAPQSRIQQHLKDVNLMLQQAATSGQRLPLSEAHAGLLRGAMAAGDGELDNAAIIRQMRRETL
jgi:3-hydroxyisobutyrate dehydrogenase-like beta-hydroxyacid dehydrogenase